MDALGAIQDDTFESLSQEVYRRTGIHLDDTKRQMLEGRMRRQARKSGFDDYDAYLQSIRDARGGSAEVDAFIDAITTNKTSFFRTRSVWEYLWNDFLPERGGAGGGLRWWSAACSTGQEAASVAALCEAFRRRQSPGMHYEVLGSDISPAMVTTASEQTFDAAGVSATSLPGGTPLKSFFRFKDDSATLDPSIHRRLKFKRHHLFEPIGKKLFDVVLLRNVVIYFTPEDRAKVVKLALQALKPDGLLVAGEAESPQQYSDEVEFVAPCIYRQKK